MTLAIPMLILDDFSRGVWCPRRLLRWRRAVSASPAPMENQGGFIQRARDLARDGRILDTWGVRLALGNGGRSGVYLRTAACGRPWQSYRAEGLASPAWREIRLSFPEFVPDRLTVLLDVRRLRLLAIGRAFPAHLAVSAVGFYG